MCRQSKNCADRQIFTFKGSRKPALEPNTDGQRSLNPGVTAVCPPYSPQTWLGSRELVTQTTWMPVSCFNIRIKAYGYKIFNSARPVLSALGSYLNKKNNLEGNQQHFHTDMKSSSRRASRVCQATWWPGAPHPPSLPPAYSHDGFPATPSPALPSGWPQTHYLFSES